MKSINKIAFCSVVSALGIVLLYIGSFFGTIDVATAVIVSLIVMITVAELGVPRGIAVYIIISVLSFVLVPNKTALMLFVFLFGLYPIIKIAFETRYGVVMSFVAKYIYLNVMMTAFVLVNCFFFVKLPALIVVIAYVVSNLALPVYDVVIARLSFFYYDRIRSKLKRR